MKFTNTKDAYRYFAVSGFTDDYQRLDLEMCLFDEVGKEGLIQFQKEIEPEVERGLFLSKPPMIIG